MKRKLLSVLMALCLILTLLPTAVFAEELTPPEESGEQTADALSELAAREDLVFDPQTSGGLLLSIDPADAHTAIQRLSTLSLPCAIIGNVTDLQNKHLIFVK